MTTQLAFHEIHFNVVSRHNAIYLTAVEIAQALGYKKSDAVTQIYERNSDEFSADMSETLNLSASGNYQKTVRIFSLRGAHLIAMFARTPIAKEFRRWVLDILDREVGHPTVAVKPTSQLSNYEILITVVNGQHISSRVLAPGEIVINADTCLEHVIRAGYVVLPCDEVGKFTLDELQGMVESARKVRDHWGRTYQQLSAR